MKVFTVEEANQLIPWVRPKLEEIIVHYQIVGNFRDDVRKAANSSQFGGGMNGGTEYVKALCEIGKLTTEIDNAGIQLKDHSKGLIDFPSRRSGRVVLLCWQIGEPDEIQWWHEVNDGFAGRQPI